MSSRDREFKRDPVGTAGMLAGGEMGRLIVARDWQRHPLGPIRQWPSTLIRTLDLCLTAVFPMAIYWGSEGYLLYNDAWRPILGGKHPDAIGQSARDVWPEIWDTIAPLFESVRSTGQATWRSDELLPMQRFGYTEECYFDYTFNPIRAHDGHVEGILNVVQETTLRVLADRRGRLLRELAVKSGQAKTEAEAIRLAMSALTTDPADVPFALFYRTGSELREACLVAAVGLPLDSPARVARNPVQTGPTAPTGAWPLPATLSHDGLWVVDLPDGFGSLPGGVWPERTTQAVILPVQPSSVRPECAAFLVIGVNPRRLLDEEARLFLTLIASHVSLAITHASAFEAQQLRAEALTDLDKAKTAFFSNVSHEFRTPLTLMLGPLENLVRRNRDTLPPAVRNELEVVNRNASRLLGLVNSLMEFSRIEAGRVEAVYRATDLAALTIGLAGIFRSTIEHAGLRLHVDCPPLPELVYVDRDMWEKIVLNLLSNAFKFTFEGGIGVELRHVDRTVELRVCDSGVGIPSRAIPQLFERFYRVEGARGRSVEGSGIGLALVQELVRLHGGTVRVESLVGRGSTFVITLLLGNAHLPSERIDSRSDVASTAPDASLFVEEALQWLPDDHSDQHSALSQTRPRVLVAEDNADMRHYVTGLLSERYVVEAVRDGEAALRAARAQRPDLILSDVMMPGLDGFALLRALREEESLKTIPVILLSARAGEESRIEGLDKGADDYLIKPFGARELLARVQTHLEMARVRRETHKVLEESEARFREMADHAPVMIWVSDPSGTCTFLSKSWYEFTAQTPETGLGAGWLDAVHPEDRPRVRGQFQQASDRRTTLQLDYRIRRYDGEYRWAIDYAAPRFDRSGKFLGYIGSVIDITDRKRTEEALRESEARFAGFMRHLPGLAWIKDSEGRYLFVNEAASNVFPAIQGGVYGMTDFELFPPETAVQFRDNDLRALGTSSGTRVVETLRHGDGVHYSLVTKFPIPSVGSAMVGGMAIDITDQKRQEVEAAAATAKFRAVFDQSAMFAGIMTVDGILLEANQSSLGICGYHATEVLGRPFWETPWWRASEAVRKQLREATKEAAAGSAYRATLPYVWADGSERIVDFGLHPIRDDNGSVIFLHPTGLDITDRKRTEDALRESERRLQFITDHAPVSLVQCGTDCTYRFVNRQFAELFGKTPDTLVGRHPRELLGEEAYARAAPFMEAVLNGQTVTYEIDLRHAVGGERLVEVTYSPEFDGHGVVVGFIGALVDITERKRAENALRHSEERLRLAMETGKVGVWDWDIRTNTASWTPSLYAIHGVTSDETGITLERFTELVHPEDRPRVSAAIQASLERDAVYELEFRAVRPDGEVVWLFTNARVMKKGASPVRMIGATIDVTQNKRTEQDLLAWNAELERRVEARTSEVMATKNRLRALARELNLAEQRERKRLAGELHDYLAQMLVVTRMKLRQTSSLMEPGKAAFLVDEADQVLAQSLAYTRSLVAELVPPALYEFGLLPSLEWLVAKMREHGLIVTLRWDAGSLTIPEDQAVLLYQSVRELLFNVLKHAGTSAATVSVARTGPELMIAVTDEGRGFEGSSIASGEKGRDRFGLFSIRQRLLTMGGRLDIDSAAGRGTRMILWVPCVQGPSQTDTTVRDHVPTVQGNGVSPAVDQSSVDQHQEDKIRVLLVDDHGMVREGIRSVLEGYADVHVVGEVSDGAEAVIAVGALAPSVVVMDINMPTMNGIQATEQISAHHPNVVVIGLSVQTNEEARVAMYQAGAAALLTKEAAVEQLYATIRQALHRDPDIPHVVHSPSSQH